MTEVASLSEIAADVALRMIGAFYVFAGIVATRAGLTSHFMDRALAAISGDELERAEKARTFWMIASSAVVLLGGVMLMLMLEGVHWVYVVSAVGQLFYLFILAPFVLDRDDPPDPAGRRATLNAAILYSAVTVCVTWAFLSNLLRPWETWSALAVTGAMLGYAGWTMKTIRSNAELRSPLSADDEAAGEQLDLSSPPIADPDGAYDAVAEGTYVPKRIKLKADTRWHPFQSMDPRWIGDVPPHQFGLRHALVLEIEEWNETFPAIAEAKSPVAIAKHDAAGRDLAIRIASEHPGIEFYFEGSTGIEERIEPPRFA